MREAVSYGMQYLVMEVSSLAYISGGKAALFSSVDNCLDGEHYHESDLTTPESLDAIRMMREAVSYGMQDLVMEVSSQAYKVNRARLRP